MDQKIDNNFELYGAVHAHVAQIIISQMLASPFLKCPHTK